MFVYRIVTFLFQPRITYNLKYLQKHVSGKVDFNTIIGFECVNGILQGVIHQESLCFNYAQIKTSQFKDKINIRIN